MNAKALGKLYPELTPRERVSLILAAAQRNDDAEQRRLADAAGRVTWHISDYYGPAMALQSVATMHVVRQLEEIGNYWHALARTGWTLCDFYDPYLDQAPDGDSGPDAADPADPAEAEPGATDESELDLSPWPMVADAAAYRFCTNGRAWRAFCKRLNVDPCKMKAFVSTDWLLDYCTELMPGNTMSAAELMKRWPDLVSKPKQIIRAADVLKLYRRTYADVERQWS